MLSQPRIAILGAGPAGLTFARLLQRRSIPYHLFERDKDRSARGQGGCLDLHQDTGQLALKEAGLYQQFLKHARPEGEVLKIYDPQGRILLNEEQEGGGSRHSEFEGRPEIDRKKLRDLLLDSLDPSTVSWGRVLLKVERDGAGQNTLWFADGVEHGFNLVVGADGAWSKVREALTDQKPLYSGVGGLDLRIRDIDQRYPKLARRVGKGMCLTLGESRGLMAQRNGDGSMRMYAFVRQPEESYRSFSAEATTNPAAVKEKMIEKFYADWDQEAKDLVRSCDNDEVSVRSMFMLPIGFTWNSKPSITLLGDAAHLMTPFAGIGVNDAMQDALELSRELGAHQETDGEGESSPISQETIGKALKRYEESMWQRSNESAQATWMYLGLFFNPRGGRAMIEHFEKQKAKETT